MEVRTKMSDVKVAFLTDSCSDIPQELTDKYGIDVIGFHIMLDGKEYLERKDMTNDQFYEMMRQSKSVPTTAAITQLEWVDIYAKYVDAGIQDLVHLCINAGGSSTYNNAVKAAELLEDERPGHKMKIHLIDSHTYSMPYGWYLCECARKVRAGEPLDACLREMQDKLARVEICLAAYSLRHSLLLGLAFAFTALCMQAIFGCKDGTVLPVRLWLPLAVFGILLAPAKLVYLPLAALFLLIPNSRFGQSAATKKAAYLAGCVLLALSINRAVLVTSVAGSAGFENQTTQTETTSAQGSTPAAAVSYTATEAADNRTLHAAPAAGDGKTSNRFANMPAEYRENTASNFVRRLYYCVEGVTEIPQKELEFWVQALQEGDVTAAVLGQSFFFSPEEVEHSSLTDDEFMSAASLVYLDRDLMTTDAEMCRERLANADRRDFFKSMFSSDECAELLSACQIYPGVEDDRYPLDRNVLIKEIEAVRTVRDSQSTPSEEDQTTFTPGYILHNLPAVAMLLVRSVVQDADNWVRGLVGGSLSYSSLDLAWFWVLALYLLLWYAAVPAQDVPVPGLPQGRYRVWCALAALLCAALAFAGCLVWTPTYYQTVYGFQGRYLLPVLPLFLLTCLPRRVQVASGKQSACTLVCCLCVVNAGVLLNAMLAVIAR